MTTVGSVTSPRDALLRLAPAARTFDASWDDPDPLDYVDVADLTSHQQGQLARGETDEIAGVFDVAEELVAGDDPTITNFIQVGFFESIQNGSPSHRLAQEAFEPYLGPLSMVLWDELNDMWGGTTTTGQEPFASRTD